MTSRCSSLVMQSVARRAFSPHLPLSKPTPPRNIWIDCPSSSSLILPFSQQLSGVEPFLTFNARALEISLSHEGRRRRGHLFPRIRADLRWMAFSTASDSEAQERYVKGGRYCILLTGHASDYTQKLYGGYGQMFIDLLGDPHDAWDVYPVVDGQFPTEEQLQQYDGFVVTGSRHDAHGSADWIAKLCNLLQALHERRQKTLGICFGHQILGRALGGKTGRADVGWEIGLREIQTTGALATKPYAVGVPQSFRVLTVHRDQVQEVPPSGELLGFSERTGIEMFAVGDHVLGIQGHPEFTEDVVRDLIDSRLEAGVLKEEEAEAARATLKAGQADQKALVRLCKGFLKRRT